MMEQEKGKEGVTRLKGNTAFHNSNSWLNDINSGPLVWRKA